MDTRDPNNDDLDRWIAELQARKSGAAADESAPLPRDVLAVRRLSDSIREAVDREQRERAGQDGVSWARLRERLDREGLLQPRQRNPWLSVLWPQGESGGAGVLGSGVVLVGRVGLAVLVVGVVFLLLRSPGPIGSSEPWPVIRGEPPGSRGDELVAQVLIVPDAAADARKVAAALHEAGAKPVIYQWTNGWTVVVSLDADQAAAAAATLSRQGLAWSPVPGSNHVTFSGK